MVMSLGSKRAAIFGSGIVLAHLLVTIVHGMAHTRLGIGLSRDETLFVILVITVFPLIAGALLWTSRQRSGLSLLALSMAGSLLFGLDKHFVAMGPDHVGEQIAGSWATVFVATAYLLLLTEALGTYIGVNFVLRKGTD
jgi:hypothetical protein